MPLADRIMKKVALLLALLMVAMCGYAAERISGTWNGKLSIGAQALTLVLHIDGDSCTMDSPDQGANGIPTNLVRCTTDSLVVEVPKLQVRYEAVKKNDVLEGVFKQMGQSFPLALKPGVPVYNRPQTPQPPFEYKTEEIFFTNPDDGAVLSGTLTYPKDYKPGKSPVVLLVTGSGLQNRDEEIFYHRPFAVIAHHLAMNGVATLRYDDRSAGKSTGNAKTATTATFVADAEAGLTYLRSTAKFGKVGLLGHSEGGTIAFILAGKGKTDFIVSLAGTAVRGDSLLVTQNRTILTGQGFPPAKVDEYCNALAQVYAVKVVYGEQAKSNMMVGTMMMSQVSMILSQCKTLPEQMTANLMNIAKADNPWIDYFVAFDPMESIKAIKCPVMAVNGEKDVQVDADINLGAVRSLLPAKDGDVIKSYPGLNHLFQHCNTGMPEEYIRITETISPELLTDITTFCRVSLF